MPAAVRLYYKRHYSTGWRLVKLLATSQQLTITVSIAVAKSTATFGIIFRRTACLQWSVEQVFCMSIKVNENVVCPMFNTLYQCCTTYIRTLSLSNTFCASTVAINLQNKANRKEKIQHANVDIDTTIKLEILRWNSQQTIGVTTSAATKYTSA